jgi:hypothetical protein
VAGGSGSGSAASQQARISLPSSGSRRRSSPQKPSCAEIVWRKCRQVAQQVEDRRQTQQRDASGCGVSQWGHRHIGMAGW